MDIFKKHKYEITLFIVDAVGMILELSASRILSPYFGSSNIVWTCVIAIILLSSSIGNYYGGKIADMPNQKNSLFFILTCASLMIFLIPIISDYVISTIYIAIPNIKIGAMVATSLIFLIPSILLGLVSPIVLKLNLNSLDNAGQTAGKLSAFSTIGAIVGTILGGFFLIPNFGCMNILFVLAICVSITRILLNHSIKDYFTIICILIVFLSCFSIFYYSTNNTISSEKVLNGELGCKYSEDTEYGRVLIYNTKIDNDVVRIFNVDGGFESLSYVDDRKYTPYNGYIKTYGKVYDLCDNINNILMIGGAGYSFPKDFISSQKFGNIDVVEIDEKLTKLAHKYFFLDDLKKDYNLEENKRFNIISNDGRIYLNQTNKKYDIIINDAFSGETPAKTLTTIEAVSKIKQALNAGGIYATNIIGSLEGKNSRFIKSEAKTIKQLFKNIYIVPAPSSASTNFSKIDIINFVLFACDNELKIDDSIELSFSGKEIIFTDDFCPVENMAFMER